MKFTIPTQVLAAAVKTVSYVLDTKNSLISCASHIKMTAKDGGVLFEVMHENATLSVFTEAQVIEEGSAGVPGKLIQEIVPTLMTETVNIDLEDNRLRIKSNKKVLRLSILQHDRFMPPTNSKYVSYVEVENFFQSVNKVSHCIYHDDNRPFMGCILVKPGMVAATDGRRLALYKFTCPVTEVMSVPYEWLQAFKKVFNSNEKLELGVMQGFLYFKQKNIVGAIRLHQSSFPNIENVIPKSAYDEASVSKLEILNALKAAHVVSTAEHKIVTLHFSNNEVTLNIDTKNGAVEDVIPCDFYKSFTENYNIVFLIDALKKLEDDIVTFTLRDKSPLVIKEKEFLQLIMPIQR